MKNLRAIYKAPDQHWVGDGFPVRSLFSYARHAEQVSPFLLLDYAGPMQFEPSAKARGVGVHPHRGFETVTIVYAGEVAHRDSTGAGGTIGPGDVQWMTAASGVVHEEFHSEQFTQQGGTLEMVQLWVNLPAKDKMSAPRYQDILSRDIPTASLPGDAGAVRVIAGEFDGHKGPAATFSPLNVWDVRVKKGHEANFDFTEGHTLQVIALHGSVGINSETVQETEFASFEREGHEVTITANDDATLLVLSGEPIDEPIVGQGPFVMNTQAEIRQAMRDYGSGKFGQL
ncbi:MAG: pirin family protein [Pseudomonadota bacterium]